MNKPGELLFKLSILLILFGISQVSFGEDYPCSALLAELELSPAFKELKSNAEEKIIRLELQPSSDKEASELFDRLTGKSKHVEEILTQVKNDLDSFKPVEAADSQLILKMKRAVTNLEDCRKKLEETDLSPRLRDLYQRALILAERNLRNIYMIRQYQLWQAN